MIIFLKQVQGQLPGIPIEVAPASYSCKVKTPFRLPASIRSRVPAVLRHGGSVTKNVDSLRGKALSVREIHSALSHDLLGGEAFFLGRPGGTESEGLAAFLDRRVAPPGRFRRRNYSTFFRKYAESYSGISWSTIEDLDGFSYRYLQASLEAKYLGFGLFAEGALGIMQARVSAGLPIVHYEAYEPWEALLQDLAPWTLSLKGMRVLVAHPFTKSIELQFGRRQEISGVNEFLPDFELQTIRPPVTIQGSATPWLSQFKAFEKKLLERDFDVALIGAGAYGLPLAHSVSLSGRKAIHTAGVTQIIFGVIGSRWQSYPPLKGFIDESWIRPLQEDVAPGTNQIEGGGYT